MRESGRAGLFSLGPLGLCYGWGAPEVLLRKNISSDHGG